jgi:hypothetical protein
MGLREVKGLTIGHPDKAITEQGFISKSYTLSLCPAAFLQGYQTGCHLLCFHFTAYKTHFVHNFGRVVSTHVHTHAHPHSDLYVHSMTVKSFH